MHVHHIYTYSLSEDPDYRSQVNADQTQFNRFRRKLVDLLDHAFLAFFFGCAFSSDS